MPNRLRRLNPLNLIQDVAPTDEFTPWQWCVFISGASLVVGYLFYVDGPLAIAGFCGLVFVISAILGIAYWVRRPRKSA